MLSMSEEHMRNALKQAKTIAVVGLSDQPDRTSYQVAKYLQANGYTIIPVNPTISEALGMKAVPSLKDLETPVDIVNVFRRSEHLLGVAEEVVAIGAPLYWAQLGLESKEAYDYLAEHNVDTVMNRCIKVEHARLV
ncbi:CoA-binding protein [Aureibacillus halotolerans]|uniref:CoA-binding domain-containing protein n=1 Tax=Aureibacillus halotolerans TaxID=1508390 RepID=A0A4R6U1B9_9BACI|nr:CoA-binding protein [Aureibacillus halotolerans]TDQ39771.1 hypothetical protein EV213_107138 [Aureibacillus halotolerans]